MTLHINPPAARESKKAVEPKKKPAARQLTASVIPHVIKGDTYLVIADAQREPEDEFTNLYFTTNATQNPLLQPPFDPRFLMKLPTLNNTLNQCVEAMEVNIDGTGYDLVPIDGEGEPDKTEAAMLTGFFDEPFPDTSFISIRRELRRQLESVGWGALEVLTNPANDVVGLRGVLSRVVRMVKLDNAVPVTKTINRGGKDTTLSYQERERRYAMNIGSNPVQLLYFREFGTTRQLSKSTGRWEDLTNDNPSLRYKVELDDRASQLLFFTVNPDSESQYGLPRWINQLPSVLGSRKAEEQNLQFFDAGGVPPAIIFLKGGALARNMEGELKQMLSGQTSTRNRILVATVQAIDGSLDNTPKVDVTVERFGADSVNDSMYNNYDARAEDHVRKGFRLPKLFLGDAEGLNFATAYTAYMVAEAQVFQPERTEFDEIINRTIVKALGAKKVKLKSKGINLKNVDAQLTALGLVKGLVTNESFVGQANDIAGMQTEFDQAADDAAKAQAQEMHDAKVNSINNPPPPFGGKGGDGTQVQQGAQPRGGLNANPGGATPKVTNPVVKRASEIMQLASDYCRMHGLSGAKLLVSKAESERILAEVAAVGETANSTLFESMVAALTYGANEEGLALVREHLHAH